MITVNEGQYLQKEEEDWLGGVGGWLEVKYCGHCIVGIVGGLVDGGQIL